ncbi:response regulator transcription factor [Yinghuangia soli]|uniref:Response regulator transcription factor n=1 Tax=Yinghuangia soli TaxID=2908204 RepID=A0AA41Q6S1_9ACTN|nr:response regulator transcription factor [Yinghuangia soli]MCF2531399.1 response regulator transcription factor [Yinghuangia soli]
MLAEDSVLLRAGLTGLLERLGFEVASVPDGAALTAAVRESVPDLVVTDVRMPPAYADEGLRAALALRATWPALPIVVLSQYIEPDGAAELLTSGGGRAIGYLLKDRIVDVDDFAATLRRVAAGGTAVDPQVVARLLRRRAEPLAALSPREREVLALIAEGLSNAAIMRALGISEPAVAKHVRGIFTKLGLPSDDDTNRRVLAVVAYLGSGNGPATGLGEG